jgi:hypothetical protein
MSDKTKRPNMTDSDTPNHRDLPSTAQLLKSTAIAAVGALAILITFVMPAEYGIDPTGIGKLTGLKQMGEIKMSLAKEAEAEGLATEPSAVHSDQAAMTFETSTVPSTETKAPVSEGVRKDTTSVTLEPNEGREIKVTMKKGQVVKYTWTSSAGKANFDVHGDSKAMNVNYHGYGQGSSTREQGEIVAAFDGSHGWFWRNRSGAPLTITLETEGPYADIKLLD